LCCVVQYVAQLHVSAFFRPSSGFIRLALRVMYPDDKYTTLMMTSQSSYIFNLIMAGM